MLDLFVGGFLILFVVLCVFLVIKYLTKRKEIHNVEKTVAQPLRNVQNEVTMKWVETTPSRKKRSQLRAKRKGN